MPVGGEVQQIQIFFYIFETKSAGGGSCVKNALLLKDRTEGAFKNSTV